MNDSLQQQCSISNSLLQDQNQYSVQSSSYYNSMLQKLRYQISLKDHAIQTASHLISQLRQQNSKLMEQHQRQLQTRDRTIEELTNKIVQIEQEYKKLIESNKQNSKSKSKTPIVNILKQKLNNKQTSEFDIVERKEVEKQKLKSRFKNYLNLSNYESKNTSVAVFDAQIQDGSNYNSIQDKVNKNYYTNIHRNSLNKRISSQKMIQTTKKNGLIKKKVAQVEAKTTHNNSSNRELADQQFLLMMQQIQLLKQRVDQKDDQILMMMKRNKQVEQSYGNLVEKVGYAKAIRPQNIPNKRLY